MGRYGIRTMEILTTERQLNESSPRRASQDNAGNWKGQGYVALERSIAMIRVLGEWLGLMVWDIGILHRSMLTQASIE